MFLPCLTLPILVSDTKELPKNSIFQERLSVINTDNWNNLSGEQMHTCNEYPVSWSFWMCAQGNHFLEIRTMGKHRYNSQIRKSKQEKLQWTTVDASL